MAALLMFLGVGCGPAGSNEGEQVDGYTSDSSMGSEGRQSAEGADTNAVIPPAGTGVEKPAVNSDQVGHPSSAAQ